MKTLLQIVRPVFFPKGGGLVLSCMLVVLLTLIALPVSADDNISTRKASSSLRGTHNGHEWVDLGLPSGLLWATCNVGADTPEGFGDYFAWGEVEQQTKYTDKTYKWYKFNAWGAFTVEKYCLDSSLGPIDNKIVLEAEDDAAAVNWGGTWRMATKAEFEELFNYCIWSSDTQNGVNGMRITGPNDNSIFLPAAGYMYESTLEYTGVNGFYYTRSLSTQYTHNATLLSFNTTFMFKMLHDSQRHFGNSIRAVYPWYSLSVVDYFGTAYATQNYFAGDIISNEPAAPAADACTEDYVFDGWSEVEVAYGSQTYTRVTFPYTMPDHKVTLYPVYRIGDAEPRYTSIILCEEQGTHNGHEWVDLGLPSGLLWATCNVGADTPEGFGDYFAWGETEPKDYYEWTTYKWCKGTYNTLTKYCDDSARGLNGFTDGKDTLELEDDAAAVNWEGKWRMPAHFEQYELLKYCTWVETSQNGVNGYLVTGPNGNSIFLPAAGHIYEKQYYYSGIYYLSSTLFSDISYAFAIIPSSLDYQISLMCPRRAGASVRAVYAPSDKVVEWYPTKMLLYTENTQYAQQFTVYIDNVQQSAKITSVDKNLLEISGIDLAANAGKRLVISCIASDTRYAFGNTIPIIVSQQTASITGGTMTTLSKDTYQHLDLVVRDSASLTIDGADDASNTFRNLSIHPTAKVLVPQGQTLNVNSVTFWGGIDEIYNGSTYELNKYAVPELSLKGNLNKAVETMDYIMRVDLAQMYQMGVPYDVAFSDITYWDNSAIAAGSQLYISTYDGQARANQDQKTWLWETDFAEPLLRAGVGYTISAEPQHAGDTYSILRLPMKSNIASGATEAEKTVYAFAYDNTNSVAITDNHKGWNYISNPYMASISGGEADSKLVLGYLVETGTGPWEWTEQTQRYVTIPADNGTGYHQQKYSEAVLKPFKSYFVQIAQEGELSFALASRQNAPARYMELQTELEVELELLLCNEQYKDNMGLLIAEPYSPAYEINADLEKMSGAMAVYTIYGGHKLAYNALSPADADGWIPVGYTVPVAGEYTFQLDEKTVLDNIEHIYLVDHETSAMTDLLEESYHFVSSTKHSESRFAINVVLRKEQPGTATGLDNYKATTDQLHKFIYNGELYILCNGCVYNANGYIVKTINK